MGICAFDVGDRYQGRVFVLFQTLYFLFFLYIFQSICIFTCTHTHIHIYTISLHKLFLEDQNKLVFIELILSVYSFFKTILFIYSWERERGGDTGRGRSRFHAGAWCGTQSRDSRITPWAESKRSTAEPPRCPHIMLPFVF